MKKTRDHKDKLIDIINEVTEQVKEAIQKHDSDREDLVQKKRQIAEFKLNNVRAC